MVSQLFTLGIGLFIIYTVFRMIAGGKAKVTPFNPTRARTSARSATSGNALLILAAVQLSLLAFTVVTEADRLRVLQDVVPTVVPLAIIGALIFLVLARSVADAVIGGLGVGAALLEAGLNYGLVGVLSVLVLTMMVVFMLGVVRGFLRLI